MKTICINSHLNQLVSHYKCSKKFYKKRRILKLNYKLEILRMIVTALFRKAKRKETSNYKELKIKSCSTRLDKK